MALYIGNFLPLYSEPLLFSVTSSTKYGFNERGLTEFRTLNKINDIDYREGDNVVFSEFRRNSITSFVKEAKELIKLNLPNSIISAAVKPNIYDAKLMFYQGS